MKRKISLLLCIILILGLFPCFASAHPKQSEHYEEFEQVFFNDNKYSKKIKESDEKLRAVHMIEYAATLCIDQFGESDEELLKALNKLWDVPGLPSSVSEINPKASEKQLSAKNHRAYTHRGWSFDYQNDPAGDRANWTIRKNILLSTVNKVFGFNFLGGKFLLFDLGYSEKCDSFCAVTYYIHILGDYLEDDNVDKFNGESNGKKIPFASTSPSTVPDVFSELLYYLPILFESQINTAQYRELTSKISKLAEESRNLVENSEGKVLEKNFENIKSKVSELMFLMEGINEQGYETTNYFYKLISNEEFFKQIFAN